MQRPKIILTLNLGVFIILALIIIVALFFGVVKLTAIGDNVGWWLFVGVIAGVFVVHKQAHLLGKGIKLVNFITLIVVAIYLWNGIIWDGFYYLLGCLVGTIMAYIPLKPPKEPLLWLHNKGVIIWEWPEKIVEVAKKTIQKLRKKTGPKEPPEKWEEFLQIFLKVEEAKQFEYNLNYKDIVTKYLWSSDKNYFKIRGQAEKKGYVKKLANGQWYITEKGQQVIQRFATNSKPVAKIS